MGEIADALRQARRMQHQQPAPDQAPVPEKSRPRAPVKKTRIAKQQSAHELPAVQGAVTLRDLVGMVHRRRVLAGAVFAAVFSCVAAATFLMTPIYESAATLLIKLGREFTTEPGGGGLLATPAAQVMKTELEILRTHAVIERAVLSIGPMVVYPDLANSDETSESALLGAATRRFKANLNVSALPDTQVARVSFRHRDPQVAAQAVNLVVEHFLEMHLWAYGKSQVTPFLKEKVESARQKLDADSDAVRAFLESHGGFSVANIGDVVGRERRELTAELDSVRREIAARRQEHAHLQKERAQTSKYEGAALREDLDAQIQKVTALLSGLRAREASIGGQLARYDQELADLPALRNEYDKLVRERDASERLYGIYSRQLEEARISEEMDRQKIANISVLQAGMIPSAPISPRKTLYLAVGAAVAAALGVLAALLAEALRGRVA